MTKKTGYLRTSAVVLAAVLAASVLVLTAAEPAEAAFPGKNGKIAYTNLGPPDNEVGAVKPDGTGAGDLTDNRRVNDSEPSWSADGEKLAFVRYTPSDNKAEIYTMNADGSDQRRLTDFPTLGQGSPTWSPDGARIAFTGSSGDRDENSDLDIYVVNADGTGLTQLTTNSDFNYDPDWSPDGAKIAFTSRRDGQDRIHTMAPVPESDANRPQPLRGGVGGSDSDWSPDGKKIVFTGEVHPDPDSFFGTEIFVMNADGTGRTRLTTLRPFSDEDSPAWSSNGKKIAFQRDSDIFVMKPVSEGDGNRARKVLVLKRHITEDLDWQPIPQ